VRKLWRKFTYSLDYPYVNDGGGVWGRMHFYL